MTLIVLGIILLAVIGKCFSKKTESFSLPVSSAPAKSIVEEESFVHTPVILGGLPEFETYQDMTDRSLRGVIREDFDRDRPENKARRIALNRIMKDNQKKADKEMEEEIRREREQPPLLTVEQAMSEHRARLTRMSSIDNQIEQTRLI